MLDYLAFRFPALARLMSRPPFWWFAVAVWFAVLFTASSQSKILPPSFFSFQDKVEHASYFCAGGVCFYLALRMTFPAMSAARAALFAVLFCSGIGATDEFHQSFIPGRSGNDVWDWTADTIGGFLAAFIGRKIKA